MSTEKNKAIVKMHVEEVWNKGRIELLNEYYALDVPAGHYKSLDEVRKRILWWRDAAPGFYFTILDMVAEDDKVVTYWQVNVTYSVVPDPPPADPMPPLGRPVEWRGVDWMRFANGKLIDTEWVNLWSEMMINAGVYTLTKPEPATS